MIGENLDDLWFGDDFLVTTPYWISLKLKNYALWKTMSGEFADKPRKGETSCKIHIW